RFGYVRIWILLRREGWPDNKKRVHRLYHLEGLQVRLRARRTKRLSLHRGAVPPASGRNQYWRMDFVHDQCASGRTFRILTVIDQWSRESVLLEARKFASRIRRAMRCFLQVSSASGRSEKHARGAVDAMARDKRRANQLKQPGVFLIVVRSRLFEPIAVWSSIPYSNRLRNH
ncbi:MAG: IS3 family transposase, partial [Peristeroidobacter soli]